MNKLKTLLRIAFITILLLPDLVSQQTYVGADDKFTSLIDTKYLKNGDIVLLEKFKACEYVRINILKTDRTTESILTSGRLEFYSFNELPDNNWVLTIITDPSDDLSMPLTFQTITFIEEDYTLLYTLQYGNETSIPLEEIYNAAVINNDELVLLGNKTVYFTDFELSTIDSVTLNKNLRLMKSPFPEEGFIYYQYVGEDNINRTANMFADEQLIAFNLGASFRDIHYLGDYAIIQDVDVISAVQGIFFQYLEQNKTIFDFRQQGQNLRYYTILNDNTITFHKLYLDENEVLQKESFDIVVSDIDNVPDLHWDSNFKGITVTNNFVPLPGEYPDNYRGRNYVLDYNLADYDLSTQNLDISIDDIQYTTTVDTVEITSGIYLYSADIFMDITITNNTDEMVEDVQLHSSAFEGYYCVHNELKVDEDMISIDPNSSKTVTARYEYLEFDNQDYFSYPLCVYAMGANKKFDQNFDDNIFCLPLLEFTSTDDKIENPNFSVYPSPAVNHIQLKSETAKSNYYIYSSQGQLISTWKDVVPHQKIDISDFNQGTYLIIEGETNKKVFFTKM